MFKWLARIMVYRRMRKIHRMLNVRVMCHECNQELAWMGYLLHGIYDEECEMWQGGDWQSRMATVVMMGQWGIPVPNYILQQIQREHESMSVERLSEMAQFDEAVADNSATVREWDNA